MAKKRTKPADGAPPSRAPNHPTVRVQVGRVKADIDELLAPLVKLLWQRGLVTYQSCQERYPGLAEIEFAGTDDVEEFLEEAQRLYRVEVETCDEGAGGELAVRVRLLVLFPTADIPRLVRAFGGARPR